MKFRKLFVCTLFFLVSLLYCFNPSFAGKQDFVLINSSGRVIDAFYISPTSCNNWEDDILGRDVLLDDEENEIIFHRSETDRYWDVKVVFKKGKELIQYRIDLFRCKEIEVFSNSIKCFY